jgi:hypothetical protein
VEEALHVIRKEVIPHLFKYVTRVKLAIFQGSFQHTKIQKSHGLMLSGTIVKNDATKTAIERGLCLERGVIPSSSPWFPSIQHRLLSHPMEKHGIS